MTKLMFAYTSAFDERLVAKTKPLAATQEAAMLALGKPRGDSA